MKKMILLLPLIFIGIWNIREFVQAMHIVFTPILPIRPSFENAANRIRNSRRENQIEFVSECKECEKAFPHSQPNHHFLRLLLTLKGNQLSTSYYSHSLHCLRHCRSLIFFPFSSIRMWIVCPFFMNKYFCEWNSISLSIKAESRRPGLAVFLFSRSAALGFWYLLIYVSLIVSRLFCTPFWDD